MTFIYKVATLNIKFTSSQIDTIRRYTKYTNIGTEQRGMGIIVKDGLTLSQVRRQPSGRGMTGKFNGPCDVNMHPLGQRSNMTGKLSVILISLVYYQLHGLI
jgi:hypothetical protein